MLHFIYELRLHAMLIVTLFIFPLSYLMMADWECERAKKKEQARRAAATVSE